MEIKVTATNVQEFKPIKLDLSIEIVSIKELGLLAEDLKMFQEDNEVLIDSNGHPYSQELNCIVKSVLSNIFKQITTQEGEKKQS